MHFLQAVRLAFETIRVQKLKSFFTVIGVTIGVTFLIAVVSIVGGMSRYMQDDLIGKLIAVNAFNLRRTPDIQMGDVTEAERREWRRRPSIYDSDVPAVAASLAPDVLWATESGSTLNVESVYASPRPVQCSTVSNDWFTIKKMGASKGRLIAPQEYSLGAPVVVIGQDVADHFFPSLDPIGRQLRIQSIPYTVIGVADKQGSAFGISLDKFLIAPEKSPLNRWVNPHGVIDQMIIQSPTEDGMREAMEDARAVMRGRHHLHPAQPDNFALETADSALEFWNKLKSYLVIAGIALPTVGLVVGAIVIMNIMLVAVSERTREIGIRKSLGARRRDILNQFLVESATLATFGAALGILLGIGFAKAIAALSPLPAAVEVWSIFVGVGVGAGVGLVAGVYPASRAAMLDPIAAMRQET
ncbi:MAG TPA: ABC transporter permease [Gemmatimonadaceae bacterium]|jgi:putative ABC transport system permease protein|nr:ABC transporter permease [Gemmatimonadaceae bacterium]